MATARCNPLRSNCVYWRRLQRLHRVHVSYIKLFRNIFHLFFYLYQFIYLSLQYNVFGRALGVCVLLREGTARDGYIIYCYGDCNRKFEEALRAQQKTGDGDNLMKAIWLDMYTDQLSARRK